MSVNLSESILSPTMLLWLGGLLIAAVLMLNLINRRRTNLTASLREYVEQNNPMAGDSPPSDDNTSD